MLILGQVGELKVKEAVQGQSSHAGGGRGNINECFLFIYYSNPFFTLSTSEVIQENNFNKNYKIKTISVKSF